MVAAQLRQQPPHPDAARRATTHAVQGHRLDAGICASFHRGSVICTLWSGKQTWRHPKVPFRWNLPLPRQAPRPRPRLAERRSRAWRTAWNLGRRDLRTGRDHCRKAATWPSPDTLSGTPSVRKPPDRAGIVAPGPHASPAGVVPQAPRLRQACSAHFDPRGRSPASRGAYRVRSYCWSGDQVQLAGPGDGLGAVGRAELGQDVAHVLFDGVQGDHELAGDGLVRPGAASIFSTSSSRLVSGSTMPAGTGSGPGRPVPKARWSRAR